MNEKMRNESQEPNELRFDGDNEMTELEEQELEAVAGGIHLENPDETLILPDEENSAMGIVWGGRGMKKLPSY